MTQAKQKLEVEQLEMPSAKKVKNVFEYYERISKEKFSTHDFQI